MSKPGDLDNGYSALIGLMNLHHRAQRDDLESEVELLREREAQSLDVNALLSELAYTRHALAEVRYLSDRWYLADAAATFKIRTAARAIRRVLAVAEGDPDE